MEVLAALHTRRSIKQFRPDPLTREQIEACLAAAVWAPNHRLTEPWHFFVITGDARARLAAIRRDQLLVGAGADPAPDLLDKVEKNVREISACPALLVVTCDGGKNEEEREENHAACAIAIQNLLLAAHAQGFGGIWRTGKLLAEPALRAFLGAPTSARPIALVYLGYPAAVPAPKPRTPATAKTTWL